MTKIELIKEIEKTFCIRNGSLSLYYDKNGRICDYEIKQKERVTQGDRDLLLSS